MASRYYKIEGMMYPYWSIYTVENYPGQGDVSTIAHCLGADTDMGDMDEEEFHKFFPRAVEVSAVEALGEGKGLSVEEVLADLNLRIEAGVEALYQIVHSGERNDEENQGLLKKIEGMRLVQDYTRAYK